jgi:predicted nucleic acid-binding protein
MEYAFWDSSALVPLCVQQKPTPAVKALVIKYSMVVWWSTPVEMQSAFSRLLRMGQLTPKQFVGAQVRMERIRNGWREIQPGDQLREQAQRLVERFGLKAADALQLAAAQTWRSGKPNGRAFIAADKQLLDAALQLGFSGIAA